jgi:PAS domain S-box-containing protein
MKNSRKTKEQLLKELAAARARVQELEALETDAKGAEAELRRHISTLKALNEISKAINEAPSLKDLLESAAELLADNPHVVAGGIYLADADARSLHLKKSFGPRPHFYDRTEALAADDPHVQSIFKSPGAVFSDELLADEDWRGAVREDLKEEGHVAAAAMRSAGEILGLFSMVLEKADVHTMAFVEMMASDLASGIRRKLAEEELVKHRQRLELLVGERTDELRAANEQLQREVGERKRAEEVLRESEEKYHAIVDWAPFGVVIYREGEILFVNSAAREVLKYGPDEELEGRSVFDLVAPEDREKAAKIMRDVKSGAGPSRFELKMLCRDGVVKLAEAAGLIFNYGGEPAFMATLVDVTERKRAEEALHESEERYRRLVETSPDAIVQTDLEGNIVALNRQTASLYGVEDVEGLVGRSAFEFIKPEQRESAYKSLREVLETGVGTGIEYDLLREDRTYYPADVNVSLVRGVDGEPRGFIGVIRDATARKRAETAVKASEERYRTLHANIPVGVFRSPAELGGCLLSANPALARMFGYEQPEDMYETRVADLYSDPDERKGFIAAVSSAGAVADYETQFRRKDGTVFWGSLSARAVKRPDGEVAYFDGILEDITGRKEAEKAVAESEEKYRTLVEQATDGVVIVQDGRVKFANQAAAKLGSYDNVEELIGKEIGPLIAPQFRELVSERYQRAIAGERAPRIFDIAILDRNGKKVPVEVNAGIVQYEGRPAAIVFARDVAERKRAERRIRYFSEFTKNIIESTQVGIYALDKKGTVQIWNQGMVNQFGVEAGELVGRNIFEAFPALNEEPLGAAIKRALSRGESFEQTDLRHRTRKKGERIINTKVNTLKDASGAIVGAVVITEDVTDRQRAEEKIKYFSEFTKNIIESTQVGIYALDKKGTVQIWNQGMVRQFGMDAEALVGRNLFEAFPGLEEEPLGAAIKAALGRGESFERAGLRQRTLTKSERVINAKVNPLRDASGRLAGAVVIAEDVTDRVETEEKLRTSEERFRTLTANIPVGVFRTTADPAGSLLSANPALAKMFGYDSPEAMNEIPVADLYQDPDDRKDFIEAVNSSGPISDYEVQLRRKDGTAFWGSLSARVIADEAGRAAFIDGVLEDVTERKRNEEALRESEEKYRTLVEQATDGVAIAQDGLLKFANRALAELLGYDDASEIIGKEFDPLIGPGFKEMVAEKHRRTMAGEAVPGIFEIAVLDREGKEIPVEINAGVVTFEGRPAAMALVRDIADRKRAEQALARSVRRNEALLEAMPDMMFVLTKDGTFTDFKADRDEDLALPRDEVIGKSVRDVGFTDDYVDSIFDCIKEVFTTGEARTLEYELEMPKGRCFYEARVVPVEEDEVLSVVRDITDRRVAFDEVKKSLNGTVYAMSKMVETRDPYTSGHQLRVARLARALAREMDLSAGQVEGIFMAAAVHDIGKISIPEGILSKPGRLTDLELNIIKNHPQVGFDILKNVEFAWPITDVVLKHHERLDGSGYPQGLSGDEISVEARILSVADVVEAMSSHRPYRPTLGVDKALEEISAYKGVLYDPQIVDVCLKLFHEKDFKFN